MNDPTAATEDVTPPPALTEVGRLRAQVEQLTEDVKRSEELAKLGARCFRDHHDGQLAEGRAVIEGHRFALSVALGLGTGAPWDAIHERVKELAAEPAASAVVSPPTDRASWAAAADHLIALRDSLITDPEITGKFLAGLERGARELRRLAVEAHDTGTQQPARCPHGCDVSTCPCLACEADDTEAPVCGHVNPEGGERCGLEQGHDWHRCAVPLEVGETSVSWAPTEPAPVEQQPAALRGELKPWQLLGDAPTEPLPQTERVIGGRRLGTTVQQVAAADGEETPSRAVLLDLVRDFLDPDPCSFDHHGYCQAHGYLGGEPGSCPHGRARKLIPGIDDEPTP